MEPGLDRTVAKYRFKAEEHFAELVYEILNVTVLAFIIRSVEVTL
jgi:hypothetical protein